MKKLITILLIMLMLPTILPTALAWGPVTHQEMGEEFFRRGTSTVAKECTSYQKEFFAGMMVPDVSVIYYYSHPKTYQSTHNINFLNNIFLNARADHPEERCFAYGVATHLVQDDVSHNIYIPESIKKYNIPNNIIHPFMEAIPESHIINLYPVTYQRAIHSMDILFLESPNYNPRLLQMVKDALGPTAPLDAEKEARNLAYALGGFYDQAFKNPDMSFLGKFWSSAAFVLSKTTSYDAMKPLMVESVDKTDEIFLHWDARFTLSPHGFESLKAADNSINFLQTLLFVGLIIVVIVMVIWFLRSKKRR